MIQKRVSLSVLVFLVLLGLWGCSLFTITLDESDSGSIQTLDVGDLLEIQLMGNASTGYEWVRVEPASFAGTPLDIVKEDDYRTLGCQLVGEPGEFVFRYRAVRPGTVTVGFEHRRPWEPEDPVDTYFVTVWVR
ncbi:protease inhibitor I42 family protein [Candidatus Bipolaricaulota bacterium]|nr:protease inhibitor I42 family protein [Candidatus Bipolaricaulota bacterium]